MKLKNKKTGKIGWLYEHSLVQDIIIVYDVKGIVGKYTSLAELNAEWEDVPEEYWFINSVGGIIRPTDTNDWTPEDADHHKEIGNYFETIEEAEKAVEKLKAWKRLKDFGCGFMLDDHCAVKFVGPDARKITSAEEQRSLSDAYKLLFRGEE